MSTDEAAVAQLRELVQHHPELTVAFDQAPCTCVPFRYSGPVKPGSPVRCLDRGCPVHGDAADAARRRAGTRLRVV